LCQDARSLKTEATKRVATHLHLAMASAGLEAGVIVSREVEVMPARGAGAKRRVVVAVLVACSVLGLVAWSVSGDASAGVPAAPPLPAPALAYVPTGMVPVKQAVPAANQGTQALRGSPADGTRVPPAQMNFFDDMQAKVQGMFKARPTLEEAEALCRDEESSGCTIEMMDLIKSREVLPKTPVSKPRWSADIDDAVFKPE